ncbi:MAG: carbon-nitrogen hydrolase family protein [Thaumarchaeota archaeon]|nr:carbon-nitrogen hydrolase family protein [Nitrososphaerota archaeon]
MRFGPTTLAAASMHVEHDPKKNFAEYERYIEEAARKQTKLLSLPESSLQGFIWTWDEDKKTFTDDPEQRKYYEQTAETVPGPTTEKVARLAKKHRMYIQFGLVEKALKDGKKVFYNSAAMVGPDGLLGAFRKVHGAWNPIYTYGDSYNVYDTSLGKVGSVICMDLVFAESARVLALRGAEIVVNSSAWSIEEAPEKDYRGYRYELLCRANAAFNQVWFVSSNEVGKGGHSKSNCYGHSLIIDPAGRVVADGGYKEGLVTAEVDLAKGMDEAVKLAGRFLKRRRAETYGDVVKVETPPTYNYAI